MRHQPSGFRWVPFSTKQKKVLTWWTDRSPYRDFDMIICDGSIRSGKTVSMIDSFMMWSLARFRGEAFILAGRSMGALKRNVLKPLFQILAVKGIPYHYNRSEHYIEIGHNTYYCFGANNEASQDVLQGLTAAGAYGDEAALFPQSFVEQMIGRCSVEGSKIWLNCNPEGPKHYIKTDYIDQARDKRILHLHFTLDDNPALSPRIKERYKRLFTGLWYKRMILGLWVLAEGAIYDMWDEDRNLVRDPVQRRFLLDNAERFYVANDYGTGTVFALGLFGVYRNKRFLIKSYYWDAKAHGRQKTDGEYVEDLKRLVGDIQPAAIIIPDDALSFIAECRKQRIARVVAYGREPGSVIRGIRAQANLLARGDYVIFDDSSNKPVIDEYSSYIWDPKAQARGEDAPLKQNDHGKDMERYFHDYLSRPRARSISSRPQGW